MYLFVFIIIYEVGIFLINPDLISKPLKEIPGLVVAVAWVHNMLTFLGLSNQIAWMGIPLVVIIILLAMQLTSKTDCDVKLMDFMPVTIESVMWAVPLIVLSLVLGHITKSSHEFTPVPPSPLAVNVGHMESDMPSVINLQSDVSEVQSNPLILNIVTGIGAGIYEELIFRLFLICILMIVFSDLLGFSKAASAGFSIVISAVLFSWHHHIFFIDGQIVKGESFVPVIFLFRTLAGVYLAVIFSFRGFCVVAATHVFHNIIAALMNAIVFACDQ